MCTDVLVDQGSLREGSLSSSATRGSHLERTVDRASLLLDTLSDMSELLPLHDARFSLG